MEQTLSRDLVQENKERVWAFWEALNQSDAEGVADVVRAYVHEDITWHGPHPINDLKGAEALVSGFWQPLLRAIPDLRRTVEIFIGGHRHWVGAVGYFSGTFEKEWLGIPPTGKEIRIRFGEFSALWEGKVGLTYMHPGCAGRDPAGGVSGGGAKPGARGHGGRSDDGGRRADDLTR